MEAITVKLDTFTQAYIECALWGSTDDDGKPLDDNYGPEDLSPVTLQCMVNDCAAFQEANREALDDCNLSLERQGHDYWLTRNRHGTGFWDEGYRKDDVANKALKALTDAAHTDGSFDLYVGDDGMIYGT